MLKGLKKLMNLGNRTDYFKNLKIEYLSSIVN